MPESLSTDNVDVAMIIAATELTKQSSGKVADQMVKNYELFYNAIREARIQASERALRT